MKNSEEAIDRVLAGLRDVETPAGLERRVLEGLEERGAARAGVCEGLAWCFVDARRDASELCGCGVALAGILVVVLAVPAIYAGLGMLLWCRRGRLLL